VVELPSNRFSGEVIDFPSPDEGNEVSGTSSPVTEATDDGPID